VDTVENPLLHGLIFQEIISAIIRAAGNFGRSDGIPPNFKNYNSFR
jgi:hypothetical protein